MARERWGGDYSPLSPVATYSFLNRRPECASLLLKSLSWLPIAFTLSLSSPGGSHSVVPAPGASPGNLLEMQVLQLHPGPTDSGTLEEGPATWGLTHCPSDPDAPASSPTIPSGVAYALGTPTFSRSLPSSTSIHPAPPPHQVWAQP